MMALAERNALVVSALPIARRAAWRIIARGVPVDYGDLVNEGALGLIDAAERYDANSGAYDTLALPRAQGAMLDYMRALDPLSARQRRRLNAMGRAEDALAQDLRRTPTRREVVAALGLTDRTQRNAELAMVGAEIARLDDAPFPDRDERSLLDLIPAALPGPADTAVRNERRAALYDALAQLPHRQRVVVVLADLDRIAMPRIAKMLGVTNSRAHQIRQEAHARLRDLLALRVAA